MSTTFAIDVDGEEIDIAFRSNGLGIRFTNPIAKLLPDETKVIPTNNTAQGIFTIGDIKREVKK